MLLDGPDKGTRFEIATDGTVRRYSRELSSDGMTPIGTRFSAVECKEVAAAVRHEAARQRRNRAGRERTQMMKDLGLVRAPGGAFGGWE